MDVLDASKTKPLEGGPSFPLRHRLLRLAWGLAWAMLGRWTPVPMHGWRRFLLQMFGARLHPTAKVYPGVHVWYPPNLTMDAYSCLAGGVYCYCMDRIELGEYALVSQRAHLCAGSHDADHANFQLFAKPIIVGPRAWIAAEAFVGPGVTVAEGAVLGARGVTVKDLAPWSIYAGNPARLIRRRRRDDVDRLS